MLVLVVWRPDPPSIIVRSFPLGKSAMLEFSFVFRRSKGGDKFLRREFDNDFWYLYVEEASLQFDYC